MRITGRYVIKDRGVVLTAVVDETIPVPDYVSKEGDIVHWRIRGIERRAILQAGSPYLHEGEPVGFLVTEFCSLAEGDEIMVDYTRP